MVYITGDTHGSFERFAGMFSVLTENDIVIILGDSGINYFGDKHQKTIQIKEYLKRFKCDFFIIRGNHDLRPIHLADIYKTSYNNGWVLREQGYDNIIYAIDGEDYIFNGNKYLVVGGAYSVDKYYRLAMGYHWFDDEQLTHEEMDYTLNKIEQNKYQYHGVLTHTCPESNIPTEWFLDVIDQSTVDRSMEKFLELIKNKIKYDYWYCGHYHGEKVDGKHIFLYNSIAELQ